MTQYDHRGRPKEFDENTVVNAAMVSFWTQGYEACSLADLLNATGLSKSSFYQSFGSKKHMFVTSLNYYSEVETAALRNLIHDARDGKAFFRDLIDSFCNKTTPHWRAGCLIANTAAEFGQEDPDIAQALKKGLTNFRQTFEMALVKGQEDGSLPSNKPVTDRASYALVALNGLRTMVKAGMDDAQIRKAGNMILMTLE
ncbi:MAG TPA: TetR/AcrR family transcriptional regulator [Hellea balneolensis]|uniref:TetR/AcrR family transcriptional regulator n=1 Tax=Hellea balneolensis TaxID=287478 RepID=A0A7C3G7Q0_9PROT|nr:TetR/AcrR family transcriptional regulator [Hellea balneolensis]